jgi:hypothetical protein
VVFSSTTSAVDCNARLVTGDAVTEITRLKTEDGGPMDIGGATLAAAAMRAGLIDEYVLATAPVLVGGGTPFFTALDNWVNLNLVETRTFPDGVLLTRYETTTLNTRRRISAGFATSGQPTAHRALRGRDCSGRAIATPEATVGWDAMHDRASIDVTLQTLARHPFRAKFHLRRPRRGDGAAARDGGHPEHAAELLARRVAAAEPAKDGKQTPYRGHPVFVAQHATATCCRTCLQRWHGIPKGRELTADEQAYAVDVICRWIESDLAASGSRAPR